MGHIKDFLARKDIVISAKRYGIDALGAMAQGLFCSLLIGTILKTLGQQTGDSAAHRDRGLCLRHGRPRHGRRHRLGP